MMFFLARDSELAGLLTKFLSCKQQLHADNSNQVLYSTRDPVLFWPLDPGRFFSGSRMPDPQPIFLRADRREIITVRGQSYVSRLPKYWPPTPSPPSACVLPPPPQQSRGAHTRRAERRVGGQYFGRRKTQDCPLTVIISLRSWRTIIWVKTLKYYNSLSVQLFSVPVKN